MRAENSIEQVFFSIIFLGGGGLGLEGSRGLKQYINIVGIHIMYDLDPP